MAAILTLALFMGSPALQDEPSFGREWSDATGHIR